MFENILRYVLFCNVHLEVVGLKTDLPTGNDDNRAYHKTALHGTYTQTKKKIKNRYTLFCLFKKTLLQSIVLVF